MHRVSHRSSIMYMQTANNSEWLRARIQNKKCTPRSGWDWQARPVCKHLRVPRCISLAPSFRSIFCVSYTSPLYFLPLAQIFYFTLSYKIVLSFSLFLSLSRARRRRLTTTDSDAPVSRHLRAQVLPLVRLLWSSSSHPPPPPTSALSLSLTFSLSFSLSTTLLLKLRYVRTRSLFL